MPTLSTEKMTAQQYFLLGEDAPGSRLELVDGVVTVSPSPMPEHSHAQSELHAILKPHIKKRGLGKLLIELDTALGSYDVRRPDLLFFKKGRTHLIRRGRPLEDAPDLCIEIVSASSVRIDRKDKFAQYARSGVAYYWIVDPLKFTIEAFKLEGGSYATCGSGEGEQIVSLAPFPELKIPLAELWLMDE